MKRVTILAFENAFSSTIVGPADFFQMTGVIWNQMNGIEQKPFFQTEIVSIDGLPVSCLNNIVIKPHRKLNEVKSTDLIMIPTIGKTSVIKEDPVFAERVIPWLRLQYKKGASISSLSTGAFLLAETGLIDGKRATTHWGYTRLFQKKYPQVDLRPDQLVTDDSNIYCAAGATAWFDLALYLVEKYCGHEIAIQCSKAFIIDMNRVSQMSYSIFEGQKHHKDHKILSAQEWIESNYQKIIQIVELASYVGISHRSFIRRFKQATGDTPVIYIQRIRVEAAKKLLESTDKSFEEISTTVGYEDNSFLRKLFKRYTGIQPHIYRKKFQKMCTGSSFNQGNSEL